MAKCLHQDLTAAIVQPGFHSQNYTAQIRQPGVHNQNSAVRILHSSVYSQGAIVKSSQPGLYSKESIYNQKVTARSPRIRFNSENFAARISHSQNSTARIPQSEMPTGIISYTRCMGFRAGVVTKLWIPKAWSLHSNRAISHSKRYTLTSIPQSRTLTLGPQHHDFYNLNPKS